MCIYVCVVIADVFGDSLCGYQSGGEESDAGFNPDNLSLWKS